MTVDVSDDRISNPSDNPSFTDILDEALSRRSVLKGGLGTAAIGFLAGGQIGDKPLGASPEPRASKADG